MCVLGLVMYSRAYCSSHVAEVSHVLVSFVEEDAQPTAIIPVKRVRDCEVRDLQEGVMCQIEWSDKKRYPTRVLALG